MEIELNKDLDQVKFLNVENHLKVVEVLDGVMNRKNSQWNKKQSLKIGDETPRTNNKSSTSKVNLSPIVPRLDKVGVFKRPINLDMLIKCDDLSQNDLEIQDQDDSGRFVNAETAIGTKSKGFMNIVFQTKSPPDNYRISTLQPSNFKKRPRTQEKSRGGNRMNVYRTQENSINYLQSGDEITNMITCLSHNKSTRPATMASRTRS